MYNRDRLLAIILGLVLAVTSVFWTVRSHDFIMTDDEMLVYNNRYFQPNSPEPLRNLWTAPHEQIYMPVTYTVWWGLSKIAQVTPDPETKSKPLSELAPLVDPGIFHSFNLVLHVLNVLLVFALLRLLIRNDWCAAIGALFFGLHPIQVESVAWVSETKGLLGAFFSLLALWIYLICVMPREVQEVGEVPASNPRLRRLLLYGLASFAFLLATLSKPATVTLPLLAWVLDVFLVRRSVKKASMALSVWIIIALPAIVMARTGQPITDELAPFWTRPLIALDAIAFYLGKILWPVRMSPEYTRIPGEVLKQGLAYWTWILTAAVAGLVWMRRKDKIPVLGFFIFVLALLPILGFVPFVYQYYSTVADRYVYVPMLGFALVISWLLSRAGSKEKTAYSFMGVILLILGVLSFSQVQVWSKSKTLYDYSIAVNPHALFARLNTGLRLRREGKLKEAAEMYRSVIASRPDLAEAYINLGAVLRMEGKKAEAVEYLLKAEKIAAAMPSTYTNLADIYLSMDENKYALLALRRAVQLEPNDAAIHLKLAEVYLKLRDSNNARKHLDEAYKLAPSPEAFYLAAAEMTSRLNYIQESIHFYVSALQLRPTDANLHFRLGQNFLRLGKISDAQVAFRHVLDIDPTATGARLSYGLTLVAGKDYAGAEKALRQVLAEDARNVGAYLGLAEIYLARKQLVQAKITAEKALKINPKDKPIHAFLKRLENAG